MVLDSAPPLLAFSCVNDENDILVVKASCDFEYQIVAVFKDIFIERKYSVEEPHLETLVMSTLLRSCPITSNMLTQSIFGVLLNPSLLLPICHIQHCFTLLWIPQCPCSSALRLA